MNRTALSLILGGALAISASAVQAATEVYLCAGGFDKTMPDGQVVRMWGFARVASAADFGLCGTTSAPYTSPGPAIVVGADEANAGGTPLTITVQNNLPVPFSMVIPGQNDTTMLPVFTTRNDIDGTPRTRAVSMNKVTAVGTTGTYTWNTVSTGTYAYHGAYNVNKSVQMGLYGALTKNAVEASSSPFPAVAAQAYAGVEYDRAVTLFYSEVDPTVHAAVAADATTPVTVDYTPQYFLINGQDNLDTALINGSFVGQRILLRFINMGLQTHSPTLMGMHMAVVAQDGRQYNNALSQYSVTLGAGATTDAVITPTIAGNYAIYDRMLTLTNRFYTTPPAIAPLGNNPGAQIGFLAVTEPVDTDGDGVPDSSDNCTEVANADQRDTNGDGFGNICDPDLNNDGLVNLVDYVALRSVYLTPNADADLNGDGIVNLVDYVILRNYYLKSPGPSGVAP